MKCYLRRLILFVVSIFVATTYLVQIASVAASSAKRTTTIDPRDPEVRLSLVKIGDECKDNKECPQGAICHQGMGSGFYKYCVCRYGRPKYTEMRRQICPDGIRRESVTVRSTSSYEKYRKNVASPPATRIPPPVFDFEERRKIAEDYYSIPDEDDPRYLLGPSLLRAAHRLLNQPAPIQTAKFDRSLAGDDDSDRGSMLYPNLYPQPQATGTKRRTLQELIENFIDLLKNRQGVAANYPEYAANLFR